MMRTDRPRVAVLVNGGEDGALGLRARGLFEPLEANYEVSYLYRRDGKVRSFGAFLRSISSLRPSVVYVLDTGASGATAGLAGRLLAGRPLIVDTGDLAYDLAELKGSPGWLGRQAIRLVERSALRVADGVVVRGTRHKELLEEAGLSRVEVIRDGVDSESCRSAHETRFRRHAGRRDFLCVGLVGSLRWNRRFQMCYGWDLIEALGLLGDDVPVRGLVVGEGDGRPYLEARARQLGVDRISFIPHVAPSQLGEYLGLIDVAVSTQTNNRVGQVRTTGKLPLYMAAGCFVIASDVGEARLLLPPEMRLPYDGVKDPRYPGRLATRIAELAEWEPERLWRSVSGTVARARHELDYRTLSSRLKPVLDSVLAPA